MGPIHGRVLLASSAAALAGPSILLGLRSRSEVSAIHDLASKVDPARFQQVFQAGVEETQALIDVSNHFTYRKRSYVVQKWLSAVVVRHFIHLFLAVEEPCLSAAPHLCIASNC